MTTSILRSVRFAFVTLLLGLTVYTVAETALGGGSAIAQGAADEGLTACGSAEQPCALEAVSVVAEPAPAHAVQVAATEGLEACGTEEQPCALAPVTVQAERPAAHLASIEHIARMTVRAGS